MAQRVELKFIVPRHRCLQLLQRMLENKMLFLDEHSNIATLTYTIESLYFDSPYFQALNDSVDGYQVRRKVRLRHYRSKDYTQTSGLFLEIKEKNNQFTHKTKVPAGQNYSFSQTHLTLPDEPRTLLAAVVVEYERYAFLTPLDSRSRITLDVDVRSKIPADFGRSHRGMIFLNQDYAILEIKGQDADQIQKHARFIRGLVPMHSTRFSKYCLGLLSLNPSLCPDDYWSCYNRFLNISAFSSGPYCLSGAMNLQ